MKLFPRRLIAGGLTALLVITTLPIVMTTVLRNSTLPVSADQPSYVSSVQSDAPISFWQLQETSGTVAADQQGQTNGAIVGSPALGKPGPWPGSLAYAFRGNCDGIDLTSGAGRFALQTFSLEMWVAGLPPAAGTFSTLFRWHNYGYQMNGESDGTVQFSAFVNGGASSVGVTTARSVLDATWHHLVITVGASSMAMYVDGASTSTTTMPSGIFYGGDNWTTIARDIPSCAGNPPFTGLMSEVSFYNSTLGATNVQTHYSAAFGLTGGPLTKQEKGGGSSPSEFCLKCFLAQLTATSMPVDDSTGNFYHTFTDLTIPGRGLPLDLERTYNASSALQDGPFGFGWSWSYGAGASLNVSTGAVTVTEENGAQITFNSNGSGGFVPAAPRITATLTSVPGGGWTLTRRGHEARTFNASGLLASETDRNNYTTTLAYSGFQLSTVTDPGGRVLTFTWTGSHVTSVHDSATPARTTAYTYGNAGDLVDAQDVAGGHTAFAYTNHLLVTMAFPRFSASLPPPVADCAATTGPLNAVSNHYDANGRVDCQYDQLGRKTAFAYELDTSGNVSVATVTDPLGHKTIDGFAFGALTSRQVAAGTPVGATWQFAYDPTTVGVTAISDPNGHVTTATYDADGNPTLRKDALGRQTTSTYNTFDELLTTKDGKNVTTTNTYDASGNALSSTTPLLDANGNPVLNGQGQPISSVTTYNRTDATHPDDVTSIVDATGNTWTYTHDGPTGYQTSVAAPATSDNSEHPGVAQVNTTLYGYNAGTGWRTAQLSARGQQATGATPSVAFTCTPPAVGCSTSTYDSFGQPTVSTDPNGHIDTRHYDPDRKLDYEIDPNTNRTTFTYDAAEQGTVVTRPDATTVKTDFNLDGTVADQVDGANDTTTYGYDAQRRLTSVVDPLQRSTAYGYDPAGNAVTKTDPGGSCPNWPITYPPTLTASQKCTVRGYDAANELTSVTYSDGVTPNVTSITYDADGQRTAMSDGGAHAWAWAWDSLHRLTAGTDSAATSVTYAYDLLGHVTSTVYPGASGGTVGRTYDQQGRLRTVTDWKNNTTTFVHTADGGVNTQTLPAATGVVDTTTFDNADSINAISVAHSGTTLASFAYGRDNASQVNSIAATGVPPANHSYTNDALERLRTQDSSTYAYDNADRVVTLQPGTVNQTFDAASEVTASGPPGYLPISQVGTASGGDTGTTSSVTLTLPAGTQIGDQVLVSATYPGTQTVSAPTGYATVATGSSGATSLDGKTTLWRHTVVAGDTAVTVNFGTAYAKAVVLVVYHNVDTASPVDASSQAGAAASKTVTLPSITTTVATDRLLVFAGAKSTSTETFTAPTGMTTRVSSVPGSTIASDAADQSLTTAGGTGTRVATFSSKAGLGAVMVALRPVLGQIGPGGTTYGYDTRGDRTTQTTTSGSTTLAYDQANRLTGYGTAATFAYSGDGLRMSKTAGTVTTPFVSDLSGTLPLTIQAATTNYIYGPGDLPLEQIDAAGTVTWYHHDQLGSTIMLTDGAGVAGPAYTYSPYGAISGTNAPATGYAGATATSLLYGAQYRDAETGLYDMRARYYDPATAQFLSRDPLADLTRSPYGYVEDNPLNAADPTGLNSTSMSPDAQHCDRGGNWGGVDPQDFEVFCGNGDHYWTHHDLTPTGFFLQGCASFIVAEFCLTLTNSHCYLSGGPGLGTFGPSGALGVTPNHSSDQLIEGWSGHVGGQAFVGGGYAQSPNGVGAPYISAGPPGAGAFWTFGRKVW
jgi:RHS repeat-associated protein